MKKIAIITGASSGMGKEFALQLPQWEKFDEFWLIARRADRLEALKEQISVPVRPIALDLTKMDAFDSCMESFGKALTEFEAIED